MRTALISMCIVVGMVMLQTPGRAAFQGAGAGSGGSIDAAFQQFWAARTPQEAEAAATAVVRSGISLADAQTRLKRGRVYSTGVDRGLVRLSHRIGDNEFGYAIDVPQNYDPARAYQVRFQLHGGVSGRQDGNVSRAAGIGTLAGADQIYVLPLAWNDVPFWGDKQLENLRVILDRLKRSYNVDENRVVLSGVSDGGTSAYYVAMHETTPFANFLPLNGAILVLANESLNMAADLFPNNLLNKPFFVVNGGRDPLYPPRLVEPYVEHMQRSGVDITYRPQPNGVHNTAWWPDVKDSFEQFVREHPRTPQPAKITWETDGVATSRRAHWLVIDELSANDPRPALADVNRFVPAPMSGFGLRVDRNRILSITPASSASTFDLQQDDVVVAVDGKALPEGRSVLDALENAPTNSFVVLTVTRGTQRLELRGFFSPGSADPHPMFERTAPHGRVDVVRDGNTFQATTRGVASFTVLLSPDVIDFSRPVKIVADGRTVFDGPIAPSVATMMKWAARDNDRTMIFGAEITVKLPK